MSAFTTPRSRKFCFSEVENHGLPSCPPPLRPKPFEFCEEEAPPIKVDCEEQLCTTLPGFFLVPPSNSFEGFEFPSASSNLDSIRQVMPSFRPSNPLQSRRHICKQYKLKPRPFSSPSDDFRQPFKLASFRSITLAPRTSFSRPTVLVPHPETMPALPQSSLSEVGIEQKIKRIRVSVDSACNKARNQSIRPIDNNCRIVDNLSDLAAISFPDSNVDASNPNNVENG